MKTRLILASAATVTVLLIWFLSIPLGVPGEWTWSRRPVAEDLLLSLVPALCWGVGLGFLVWVGSWRIESCRRIELVGWLSGLLIACFGMLSGLREAAPPEFRAAKAAWVLYYPGSSGYFTEARKIRDTREFLAQYEQGLQKGDVLHQGTHPPGLILGYRGLMWSCSQSAWLRQWLLSSQPYDLQEAFRIIAQDNLRSQTPLTELDRCVIWLAFLLMQFCAAATVIPLFFLLRLHSTRVTSWQLTSFWPLVPAVTVFAPKSDVCFPLIGCTVLALWLYGLRHRSRWLSLLSGMVFWFGMILSLAMLPVAFLAGLLTVWYVWGCAAEQRLKDGTLRFIQLILMAGCGFLIPTFLLGLTTGCNLVNVWGWNYQNHAGFYEQYQRTYWKWLLVNPLELSMALGLPLVVITLSGLAYYCRSPRSAASGPFWMSLATWSILWLTGKNMGEAARLWIFLMPWLIWSAGPNWASTLGSPPDSAVLRNRWLFAWCCQFVVALAIITRIAGFHSQA